LRKLAIHSPRFVSRVSAPGGSLTGSAEALSAGWTFELLRRGVVRDHDATAGLEAFRDKNALQKNRRNAARDFWTKPAI